MAKSKLANKEIQEEVQLGGGLVMIKFTDGTFIVVSGLSDVIEPSEIGLGKSSDDEDDDDEDDEDEEEGDDDDDDSDEEEDDEEDEDEEEDEEEELTAEDLMEMDADDLEDLVDDEDLDVDVDKYEDDEEGLRKAIAKVLGLKLPAKSKGKKGKK